MATQNVRQVLRDSETKMEAAGIGLLAAVVSYDVNGASRIGRAMMRKAISDAGFARIAQRAIPVLEPEAALIKAALQIKAPKGMACIQFPMPDDDSPLAFGIWKGDPEGKEKGKEKPTLGARVRVGSDGKVGCFPVEDGPEIPECLFYGRTLADRANRLVAFCETSDVTGALASVLEGLHGAKVCNHGRGHLLLAGHLPTWLKLADSLAPFGVTPYMNAMWELPSDVSMGRTVTRESFAEKIRALREKCREMSAKSHTVKGPRSDSVQNAVQECTQLLNEGKLFAGLLGDLQEALAADIAPLRAAFSKMIGGNVVSYTDADCNAPLRLIEADKPTEQGELNFDPLKLSDGTELTAEDKVIPSGDSAEG